MYQTSDSYFGVLFFQNHCQGNLKIFQEINNKNIKNTVMSVWKVQTHWPFIITHRRLESF